MQMRHDTHALTYSPAVLRNFAHLELWRASPGINAADAAPVLAFIPRV